VSRPKTKERTHGEERKRKPFNAFAQIERVATLLIPATQKEREKNDSVQNEPLCGFGCENDEIYRLCMFLRMHFRGRVEGGIGRGKELYYDMRHHENLISLGG
jgi:hypothetical protein